jgi:hypothetical protein
VSDCSHDGDSVTALGLDAEFSDSFCTQGWQVIGGFVSLLWPDESTNLLKSPIILTR